MTVPPGRSTTTVHLVYPHGSGISAPDAIGRNLGRQLSERYAVVHHDWTDRAVITPAHGDVLVGHPHPSRATIFQRSCRRPGWRRVLMLAPFNHDLAQVAFEDAVIPHCDRFLAICGPYWFTGLERSPFSHWAPRMQRLDLAVDRADFPPVKSRFNAPGARRLVYIGHTGAAKNTGYLSEIARRLPGTEVASMGPEGRPIPGLRPLGWQDFSTTPARELVSGYDFMITVGIADANPATILEAMAWGLIPICTPESGYTGVSGIFNVPLGQPERAARAVSDLLQRPTEELHAIQRENWSLLDCDYTWDRFAERVATAIESEERPAFGPRTRANQARFALATVRSNRSREVRAALQLGSGLRRSLGRRMQAPRRRL